MSASTGRNDGAARIDRRSRRSRTLQLVVCAVAWTAAVLLIILAVITNQPYLMSLAATPIVFGGLSLALAIR